MTFFRDPGRVASLARRTFVPPDLSTDPNLFIWYQSDYGITTDGGSPKRLVNNGDGFAWLDKSGNSHHLKTLSGSPPDNGAPQFLSAFQNGKGSVQFDNNPVSPLRWSHLNTAPFTLAQPFAVFLCIQMNSGFNETRNSLYDGLSANHARLLPTADFDFFRLDASADSPPGPGSVPLVRVLATSVNVVTAIYDGASSLGQLNNQLANNGNPGGFGFDGLTIGGNWNDNFINLNFWLVGMSISTDTGVSTRELHKAWWAYYAGVTL